MRWPLLALASVLVSSVLAGSGWAQAPCACGTGDVHASSPVITGGPVILGASVAPPVVLGEGVVATSIVSGPAAPAGGQVLPYSYYVTSPSPARIYVDYGPGDQFPFYGRAYGNPGDRWSWYYMGGGDRRYLAKYYYPLLR